jgi:hypothetical protein
LEHFYIKNGKIKTQEKHPSVTLAIWFMKWFGNL